jgi:seryl-tRNA synthetase
MERARGIYDSLGLETEVDLASDPFFGRGGRMLARNQRELQLKFEVIAPVAAAGGTAITSFNYHQEHFSTAFGIEQANGRLAHTACLGFGLERVTLALFARHGMEPGEWPAEVRRVLERPGEASWP